MIRFRDSGGRGVAIPGRKPAFPPGRSGCPGYVRLRTARGLPAGWAVSWDGLTDNETPVVCFGETYNIPITIRSQAG